MILDQVFFGVLNEKAGTLEVFEEPQAEVSSSAHCQSSIVGSTVRRS